MNRDEQKFSDGLTDLIRQSRRETASTVEVIDELGYALNDETRRIEGLFRAIDLRDTLYRRLIDRIERPRPTPLSEARREAIASGIAQEMPRMFQAQSPTPPPIPQEPEYHQPARRFARG
jgi:hypothetical protein